MTVANDIVGRIVEASVATKKKAMEDAIDSCDNPSEVAKLVGLPDPGESALEQELFPVRLSMKMMSVGMGSSAFGMGEARIKDETGASAPVATIVVERSAERLIEELFEAYPGAAGRYFAVAGRVESVMPSVVEYKLFGCGDGSLISRLDKKTSANEGLGKAVLAEARGVEDCSETIRNSLEKGVPRLVSMFEEGVKSEAGRRKLPGLSLEFLFDVMRDAIHDGGSASAPLDNMAEFAEEILSKLADPVDKKWKEGVESVSLDGSPVGSLSEIKLGLGIPDAISLKEALAKRKAAMASTSEGSGAASFKL